MIVNLDECRKRLEELEEAREELLRLLREIRIHSTKSIALMQSGKKYEAEMELERALSLAKGLSRFKEFPEIFFYLCDEALQELVEALAFKNAIEGNFSFEFEVEATPSAYLCGLADAIGEMRRYALTKLIAGEFDAAEKLMATMEKIYENLVEFTSFPEKLVSGLRKKLDVARGSIERTKSDFIAAKVVKLNESLGGN